MTRTVKLIRAVAVLFLTAANATAGDDAYLISQQRYIKISPLYQHWSTAGNTVISEMSTPVVTYLPLRRNLSLTLRGAQAHVGGEALQSVSAWTDMQAAITYHWAELGLVLDAGLNLPSGKHRLSPQEFETSFLLSQNVFEFQMPALGQGVNLALGASWATPVSEQFVLGLGLAYQIRGDYQPVAGLIEDFRPGDELVLTGGLDFRVNETSSISSDLSFTTIAADKIGEQVVFDSGNKFIASVQFRKLLRFNEIWLFGRFRNKASSQTPGLSGLTANEDLTLPDQFELRGHYRFRLNPAFYCRVLAEARFFEKTAAILSGIRVYGLGVAPDFTISPNLQIGGRFNYLIGFSKDNDDLASFELGMAITASF